VPVPVFFFDKSPKHLAFLILAYQNEKIRFYRMAKRSATECASIFDICQRLQIITESYYLKGRELLIRIVAMLTKMAKDKG
jgi:four helix bundle protein